LVQLKTKQNLDGDRDVFSVNNKGVLMTRKNSYLLSYFQENVHHSLEFFPKEERVVMMRNWKDRQRVEYLSFATRSVEFLYDEFSAGRAEVRLRYFLYQFEQLVADTELSIAIFPLKG